MRLETEDCTQGFRLSPQQRRLWAERQRHGDGWQKSAAAVTIEGELDAGALKSAVAWTVERHEILRTRYFVSPFSGEPLQLVGEPSFEWRAEPASLEGTDQDRIEKALSAAWSPTLDLESSPVLSVSLTPLGCGCHVLVLALPSLASDAVGILNLAREIGRSYRALVEGAMDLEGEVAQYADLAEWQNELLESEEMEDGRAFWQEEARSSLPAAPAPFGERGAAGEFDPQTLAIPLAAGAARRAEDAARRLGVPLQCFLLGCWQVLLWRSTGADELALGVDYEGRRHGELAGALGRFVRTLPSFCRLGPGLALSELMRRVARQTEELARYQEYFAVDDGPQPFSAVRFGVLAAGEREDLGGVPSFRVRAIRSYGERFRLTCFALLGSGSLAAELQYDGSVYSREEAALLAGRFARLLESATEAPLQAALRELKILPEDERRRVLAGFNPQARPLRPHRVLHELFEEQAGHTPERFALSAGEERVTYAELNAWANRLARRLRSMGAGPEVRVAVFLERSAELVVALLAVLKAGAAYVPLDPIFPRDRVQAMLRDSEARLLVSARRLLAETAEPALPTVMLDADEGLGREPDGDLGVAVDPRCLAYVLFTSGSTGRPKAVGVEHRQILHYLDGVRELIDLPDGSSYATASTFSADLGNTSIFLALASGGCLHVIGAERAADARAMTAYFRENSIDCLKIVPSHLSALLASVPMRELLPRRKLVLGGEASSWEMIERLRVLAPGCAILNHYGPTETTVGAAAYPVGQRVREAATVPIGRPLGHARIYLVDESGCPVPVSAPGEVYLGGATVSRGYLGDASLTAAKFVPDPFGAESGARLYRTGDRARWLLSGDLEFLGRVDDQLKVRGFRVEPGEVEKALERHPAVAAAKVVGREASPGDLQLAAYVTVDTQEAGPVHRLIGLWEEGKLRGELLHDLPDGSTVVHLDEAETRLLAGELFEESRLSRHGIRLPEAGACVFDVGAHIGLFSQLAARCSPGAKVFAFEPGPAAFRVLRLNSRVYDGIRAFDCALAAAAGEGVLTHYSRLTLRSSLHSDPELDRGVARFLSAALHEGGAAEERLGSETIPVRLRRLSDILAEHAVERIDLLKVDTCGGESGVLAGIDEGDWPRIRQVVLETPEALAAEIVALLAIKGYEVATERISAFPVRWVYARRLAGEEAAAAAGSERRTAARWSGPGALIADLRRHLQAALPEHMVPSTVSLLPAFPLTPNGKLDRRALPAPEETIVASQRPLTAPQSDTEKKLFAIWNTVLGPRRFGIHDSFFEIGGHSLLATRILARIQTAFQVEMPLRTLFENPTIARLARLVERSEPSSSATQERITRLVREAYRHSRPPLD